MAKLTIMNELQITILLLLVISFSATFLAYIIYIEYNKIKHLNYVKSVISLKDDDQFNEILEKREKQGKKNIVSKLTIMMKHAGLNFHFSIFLIIFFSFVVFSGSLFTLFLQHWIGYVIGIPFGIIIFWMTLQNIILRRKKEFNRALATSISVLVKMMKNGIGFEQALTKSISVSSSKLFKGIFSNFFQEKNTLGEDEAFKNLNNYVASKELLIFALAIKIGRASGGQFSNTLEKVEEAINYRKRMQEKVDVVTREGSIGSYIVVAISIFLYFSLNENFDGKLHEYFMHSEYGRFQLLGIGMWIFMGMIANKFITRVDK
jgi:tight adherence protein B